MSVQRVNCKVRKSADAEPVEGFDDRAHFGAMRELAERHPVGLVVGMIVVEFVRTLVRPSRRNARKRRRLR